MRLSWRRRWRTPFVVVFCASLVAGCSYRLSSLAPKDDAGAERTGALVRPASQAAHAADVVKPSEFDLAYARAAAVDALVRGGKDNSVPWENPQTGAGGNITPLAASHSEGPQTCRDFLASYVRGDAQAWLQGEACRSNQGEWQVKSLTPLKRS